MSSQETESSTSKVFPTTCPQCGGDVLHGFGLAFGGYGSYVACLGEKDKHCQWYVKEQEETESLPDVKASGTSEQK